MMIEARHLVYSRGSSNIFFRANFQQVRFFHHGKSHFVIVGGSQQYRFPGAVNSKYPQGSTRQLYKLFIRKNIESFAASLHQLTLVSRAFSVFSLLDSPAIVAHTHTHPGLFFWGVGSTSVCGPYFVILFVNGQELIACFFFYSCKGRKRGKREFIVWRGKKRALFSDVYLFHSIDR